MAYDFLDTLVGTGDNKYTNTVYKAVKNDTDLIVMLKRLTKLSGEVSTHSIDVADAKYRALFRPNGLRPYQLANGRMMNMREWNADVLAAMNAKTRAGDPVTTMGHWQNVRLPGKPGGRVAGPRGPRGRPGERAEGLGPPPLS